MHTGSGLFVVVFIVFSCASGNTPKLCTNLPRGGNRGVSMCYHESDNCTIKQALFTKNVTQTVCQAPVRTKSQESYIITVTFGVISGVTILIRIGFKALVAKVGLGWDDWAVLTTFFSGLPSTIVATRGTIPNGLGRDIWTLTFGQITRFGEFFYIMTVLYFLQVTLLKMALLFFYLKIFPDRLIKRLLWGTIAFNAVFGALFVVLGIFQCQPVSFVWTKWDGEHQGKCLSINGIAWANAAVSIVLDFWMLAIPLSQLRKLHMHWKKKAGVGLMFCVGAFVTVVSILRLKSLVSFANTQNPSWDYWNVTNWSVVEINVGIICTCMPALRLIIVRVFPALGSSTYASNNNNYYKSGSRGGPRSKGRSRAGTDGQMPENEQNGRESRSGVIYQQRTYTVQYGDNDEQSLVRMQDLDMKGREVDFKGSRLAESTSEVSI
ncbi:CFEM domain-containing protein [Pleurostoma richardsiae]|uniref:CFEM domain-containing protein n=1 Tax=Pleurostoma richardsiae TaxID=41990 RepID=A0AA38VJP8_9PEZI|nr:CFEM domain-containing protein [Pleurostoma richardsiae]